MGTGVVGLNLAQKEALLCDTNPHLIAFYDAIARGEINGRSVRKHLVHEGNLLRDAGEDHYYAVRARFNDEGDPLDFLFLNRAGFNGMIRFNKKGGFNVPFCRKPERFAPAYITKIVNQVDAASCLIRTKSIKFACQGYEETIADAQRGDIIYCDPPYIDRHSDYYNQWSRVDEIRLRDALVSSGSEFILSTWLGNAYRENIGLRDLWDGFQVATREHYYHVGANLENRGSITEALVFSDGLDIHLPKEPVVQLALSGQ